LLRFFDCNCMLGRLAAPPPGAPDTLDALREEMRWCGIERGLVCGALAREYDPGVGNQALVERLRGQEGLYPCFVLLPPETGEIPFGEELLAQMEQAAARAARVFPGHHSHSLHPRCCGRLLGWLEEEHIPLFVDLAETNWDDVGAVCRRFPDLTLVLLRVGYRIDRQAYPLLEAHPHLCLETSYYQTHRGIEEVVSRFGAERLIFGTGYPFFAPGGPVAALHYAEISDADKALIAGGNLAALLGVRE